jgi:uncharacterized membrane protein
MKKWKCTVCGYIHDGDEPPEKCPVCGATKDKFVEVLPEIEEKTEKVKEPEAEQTISPVSDNKILDLMVKHHAHPISVHFPNGVVPISVIFLFIAVMFNFISLAQAAFYNLLFVLLSMPMVLFSGYNEWQRKYGGNKTSLFIIKIVCGFAVSITASAIVIWYVINPEVTGPTSPNRGLFLLLNVVMLAATGIAGHLGGKLVFKD